MPRRRKMIRKKTVTKIKISLRHHLVFEDFIIKYCKSLSLHRFNVSFSGRE